MADRELRLKAGVDDQATKPLKEIQSAIKALSKEDMSKLQKQFDKMSGGLKTQHKAVQGLRKGLDELREGFNPLATAISSGGTAGLAMFGVGALSLVGIMDGLKDAIAGVAEKGKSLQNLSAATGLSTNQLQSYTKAMDRYGISAEQTTSFLTNLNEQHFKLQRGVGWGAYAGPLHGYGEKLKDAKNVSEEVNAALDEMDSFHDINKKRMFAREKLGDEGLAALPRSGAFAQMMGEVSKTNMSQDDVNKAAEFSRKWEDLTDAIEKMKNDVGVSIIPAIEGPLKDFGAFLNSHEGDIKSGLAASIEAITQFGKELGELGGDMQAHPPTGIDKARGVAEDAGAWVYKNITAPIENAFAKQTQFDLSDPSKYTDNMLATMPGGRPRHPGSTSGLPVYSGAYGDPLKPLAGDGVNSDNNPFGTKNAGKAGIAMSLAAIAELGKPEGVGAKIGKQVGESFLDEIKDFFASPATAGTLAGQSASNLARVSSSAGGVDIGGATGGGLSRRRGRGGGSFDAGSYSGKISGANSASASQMMDFLVTKHGWTPAAAAVAAAQANAESSFNPSASGDPSVPGGSHGLFQWNRERLAALKKFGGANWQNRDVQEEFFAREAEHMLPNWKNQKDLSHANELGKAFEGYKGPIQPARAAHAAHYLSDYGGLSGAVRADRAAKAATQPTVTPATATGTVNVHITGDRKDKVSVNSDGLFSKVKTSRRFFTSQQEVG